MDPTILSRLQAAEALANAGRLAEAENDCRAVLAAAPAQPEAAALLGIILARRGGFDAARSLLHSAIRRRQDVPQWHHELAQIHRRAFRLDEALRAGHQAVRLDPHNPRYLKGLAQVHFDRAEDAAARNCLIETLSVVPDDFDAHLAMAHALLSAGEFLPGWIEYQWRLRSPLHQTMFPPMARPAWNGMRLPGKRLLLVADQGYGDGFLFARYIALAAERCDGVSVLCRAAQAPLLARIEGVRACVTHIEDAGDHAAFAWLASLPFLFGTEMGSIPEAVPYLWPEPSRIAAWRDRFAARQTGPERRVGLVWSGNAENTSDWRRSVALGRLRVLGPLDGVRFVSLQPLVAEADRDAMAALGIEDLSGALTDFGETAAIVANLDLILTVDSAVAHLAGAMGVPAWVLVHHPADWRWLAGRDDSPWYPSMRLFRQPRAGDWDSPISDLAAALCVWAGYAASGQA